MTDFPTTQRLGAARTKRYKTSLACTTCRARKLKCDGARPGTLSPNLSFVACQRTGTCPRVWLRFCQLSQIIYEHSVLQY